MAMRILAYECEYCGATKRSKKIIFRHEDTCLQNPNSKNCLWCEYSARDHDYVWRCTLNSERCRRAMSAKCDMFKRIPGDVWKT